MKETPDNLGHIDFVFQSTFVRTAKKLLGKGEIEDIKTRLTLNPTLGTVEAGTGGMRKMRVALPGGGRSGGARVIYYYVASVSTIRLVLAYQKNAKASLTQDEKKWLKALAAIIDAES